MFSEGPGSCQPPRRFRCPAQCFQAKSLLLRLGQMPSLTSSGRKTRFGASVSLHGEGARKRCEDMRPSLLGHRDETPRDCSVVFNQDTLPGFLLVKLKSLLSPPTRREEREEKRHVFERQFQHGATSFPGVKACRPCSQRAHTCS